MQKLIFLLLSTIFAFQFQAQSNADIKIHLDKTTLDLVERKTYSQVLQRLENKLLNKVGANANLVQQIYEQPLALGIDTSNQLIAFLDMAAGFSHIGVQIPLANASLFESKIKQYASNNLLNIKPIDSDIANERIKATLEVQRAERIARRRALFSIQAVAASNTRFIQQNDFVLAWTSTHAFFFKSSVDNSREEVESYEGGAKVYYQNLKQELVKAQIDYIKDLQIIPTQNLQHDISIQLSATASAELNAINQASEQRTPFLLLFDENIMLENVPHQIFIDFEQNQIAVQLLENEVLKTTKNWTKAALTADWSEIELQEGEDSLDVWLKVLGQRIQ
ncbi:MAG: hypothetical protein AAF806_25105 [Bacteroidota bacterium]